MLRLAFLVTFAALVLASGDPAARAKPSWYRGVTHIHSLWSDGDARRRRSRRGTASAATTSSRSPSTTCCSRTTRSSPWPPTRRSRPRTSRTSARASAPLEELLKVRGLEFFEVFNGHQDVYNWGNPAKGMPPTERPWDVVQSLKLREEPGYRLYGVATDDSHHYADWGIGRANPGRGWVMVRADRLETPLLVEAMKRGDFYATTGVVPSRSRWRSRARPASPTPPSSSGPGEGSTRGRSPCSTAPARRCRAPHGATAA